MYIGVDPCLRIALYAQDIVIYWLIKLMDVYIFAVGYAKAYCILVRCIGFVSPE